MQKIGEPEPPASIKPIEWVSRFNQILGQQLRQFIPPVFVVMVLIYPLYPTSFSIEKYFVKRGFAYAVSEFELVRKILYVAIPLLIFFTVIEFLKPLFEQFVSEDVVAMFTENIVFYSARGFLFLTVLVGLLKGSFFTFQKAI